VLKFATATITALLACLLLSACGGGGDSSSSTATDASEGAPTPANSVDDVVATIEDAAQSSDCDAYTKVYFDFGAKCDPDVIGSTVVKGSDSYGSAGVIDLVDNRNSKVQSCDLAMGPDGELKIQLCAYTGATVGTTADDPAKFDQALNGALDGLRTKNCDEFFKYADTGNTPKQAVCGSHGPFSGDDPVLAALMKDTGVEPESMGGNGTWQFYGISLDDGKFVTAPVACHGGKCLSEHPLAGPSGDS
jgi:hypothetical protein